MMLRSCYCCGLRHGVLAVAIIFLSLSVMDLLGVLIGWGAADAEFAYNTKRYPDSHYGFPGAVILVPMTIFVIVKLVFDVLLLLGVHLSSTRPVSARRYLAAWILFRAVVFVIISLGGLGLLIAAIVFRYGDPQLIPLSISFGAFFVMVLVISGLFWFAWVVVLSFYWHLRTAEITGVIYNRMQMEASLTETSGEAGRPGAAVQVGGQNGGQNGGQR